LTQTDLPITRQLITSEASELHEESIDTFAKSMSKKLGYPVYASFNLDLPPTDVKMVCAAVRKAIFDKFLPSTIDETKPKLDVIAE
jgi:hypothetical protein